MNELEKDLIMLKVGKHAALRNRMLLSLPWVLIPSGEGEGIGDGKGGKGQAGRRRGGGEGEWGGGKWRGGRKWDREHKRGLHNEGEIREKGS